MEIKHNGEFHGFHPPPNVIRAKKIAKNKIRKWAGHTEGTGNMRNSSKVMVGKT
jgi:hypothetical protein